MDYDTFVMLMGLILTSFVFGAASNKTGRPS
jgi:hypothetical protein